MKPLYIFDYRHYSDMPAAGGGAIVVVVHKESDTAPVSALEGVFVTDRDLAEKCREHGLICQRKEMPAFEAKHHGIFVPN